MCVNLVEGENKRIRTRSPSDVAEHCYRNPVNNDEKLNRREPEVAQTLTSRSLWIG